MTNLQPLVVEKLKRTPCSTHNLKLSVAETVEVDVQESTAESEHSEPIHSKVTNYKHSEAICGKITDS